ncbi:hypothetical protein SynBIOSE41_03737 [Synechococcus sp. BIOS-E4-1]|nr:hypothetical protein SynBIOSE41_03737 [Synechococcus sp. BIOS-E4-1]
MQVFHTSTTSRIPEITLQCLAKWSAIEHYEGDALVQHIRPKEPVLNRHQHGGHHFKREDLMTQPVMD